MFLGRVLGAVGNLFGQTLDFWARFWLNNLGKLGKFWATVFACLLGSSGSGSIYGTFFFHFSLHGEQFQGCVVLSKVFCENRASRPDRAF